MHMGGLFKKYREFWISAGYVYSIFDFFVALCWYSCPSLMLTSSAILNVQLIFDSCLLGRVLAGLRFLPIPKNGSNNLYQIFVWKTKLSARTHSEYWLWHMVKLPWTLSLAKTEKSAPSSVECEGFAYSFLQLQGRHASWILATG